MAPNPIILHVRYHFGNFVH